MADLVTYERTGAAARVTFDDGKVNVMSPAMLQGLHDAFDRAASEKAVVVLSSGRPSIFSAGFDLKVIRGPSADELHAMLSLGADLALKILAFPRPVITVVEGSAFPMGAFLVLASDWRIGAGSDWKIGLNEVQIGIPVPRFGLEVARQRLHPAYFSRTAMLGEMFGPAEALQAGFIDQLVPAFDLAAATDAAIAALEAAHPPSHATTKRRARASAIAAMRAAIDEDITLAESQRALAARAA
jgi:enoyl-CoA hydratase